VRVADYSTDVIRAGCGWRAGVRVAKAGGTVKGNFEVFIISRSFHHFLKFSSFFEVFKTRNE